METKFSSRRGGARDSKNESKEFDISSDHTEGNQSADISSITDKDVVMDVSSEQGGSSGGLSPPADKISNQDSNRVDNPGKASNTKVPDRNHNPLGILLLITTGMLISFASVGIAMNAGYKADSPVVWGPLTLSIVCMLTLVGLCNSRASNSIKPQAVRELNPEINRSSRGFGPY